MEPIAHAISYVEPDGTKEVDFKLTDEKAARWAEWCRRDGCVDVEIRRVYMECEITLLRWCIDFRHRIKNWWITSKEIL